MWIGDYVEIVCVSGFIFWSNYCCYGNGNVFLKYDVYILYLVVTNI